MIDIPEEIKNKKFTLSGAMLIFIILLSIGAYYVYDDYKDTKESLFKIDTAKADKAQIDRLFETMQKESMDLKEVRYNLKKVLLKMGLPYTEIGTPEIIVDTIKGEN